ncbi:hypothetical protein RvY_18044 [Ramazzottius varieornatus]|uniref:non-specific serine/threonine protein kinase n=1 Tax=Ramazzottius varieornatus TaxID=947166 RepID=A0A1D1W9S0_RAMVA|nr:hypothetical protein RvY_18044 [Ramazzottius varieornatus]
MQPLCSFPFPASQEQEQYYNRFKPLFGVKFVQDIGRGNHVVSLVLREDTGEFLARKSYQPETPDLGWTGFGDVSAEKERQLTRNRVLMRRVDKVLESFEVLRELNHPNIIKHLAVEVLFDPNRIPQVQIFMECCSGGTLSQRAARSNGLSIPEMKRYTMHIASGLAYLHSQQIVHLDLKGQNIVINDQDVAKLCDFGEMVKLEYPQTQPEEVKMHVGTPRYKAPEMTQEEFPRGRAADIFSFGCVLIEMKLGRPPLYNRERRGTQDMAYPETEEVCISYNSVIGKGPHKPGPQEVPQHWYLLYRQALQIEPASRPTAAEILRHPALKWEEDMRLGGDTAALFSSSTIQVECADVEMDDSDTNSSDDFTSVTLEMKYAIELQSYPAPREKLAVFLDRLNLLVKISRPEHANIQKFFGTHLTESNALYVVHEVLPNGSLADLFRHFSVSCNVLRYHRQSFRFENAHVETRSALAYIAKGLAGQLKVSGRNKEWFLTTKTLLGIACQIASAMDHLANLNVVHLSLSMHSIFFNHNFVPKICLPVQAVELPSGEPVYAENDVVVPVNVRSPELVSGRVSKASDVWAFGVLLVQCFQLGDTGGVGWQSGVSSSQRALSKIAHAEHVSSSPPLFVWSQAIRERFFPPPILEILEGCFRLNPSQRSTFPKINATLRSIKSIQQYGFYFQPPPSLCRAPSAPTPSKKRPCSALANIGNVIPSSQEEMDTCDGPMDVFSHSFNDQMV